MISKQNSKLRHDKGIDIEESPTVIEYCPSFFPGFADCRHLYNVRPFHENQNSLRAEPDRLSARRWCSYCSLFSAFARHNQGEFVLRIEDTDLERSTPEAIEAIMDGMNWLNLQWDEGPYFQTKRFDRYNAVIDEMLVAGTAYKCYCSKERLDALREEQMANGENRVMTAAAATTTASMPLMSHAWCVLLTRRMAR